MTALEEVYRRTCSGKDGVIMASGQGQVSGK